MNEQKQLSQQDTEVLLARTMASSSMDAFLLSVVFAAWGIGNIVSGGGGIMIAVGAFQLFASYLNFGSGMQRRALAKAFKPE